MKLIVVSLMFITFSIFLNGAEALAIEVVKKDSWSKTYSQIEMVYASGNAYNFTLTSIKYAGGTCTGGRQFNVSPKDANYDVKVKTILSAFMAKRTIRVFFDGVPGCAGHIDRLIIR